MRLTESELQQIVENSVRQILIKEGFFKKAGIALKRKDILSKTIKALNVAAQAKITAMLIPPIYKIPNVAKWAKKYNSFIYPQK